MGNSEFLDLILKLAVFLAGAGAVYGGIRADLKAAHQKAEEALSRAANGGDGFTPQPRKRDRA